MTPIKQILSQFKSMYAAGKHHGIHPQQLKRWEDAGAIVDGEGQVFMPAKCKLVKKSDQCKSGCDNFLG